MAPKRKSIAAMDRKELEAESKRLNAEKVRVKRDEAEVNQRLDVFRELDRLQMDPERVKNVLLGRTLAPIGEVSHDG